MFKEWISKLLGLTTALLWLFTLGFLFTFPRSFFTLLSPVARWWCKFVGYSQGDTVAFLSYLHKSAYKTLLLIAFGFSVYVLLFFVGKTRTKDGEKPESVDLFHWSKRECYLLCVVMAVAASIRLYGSGRGLTYDELFTAFKFVETPSFWHTISSYIVFNNHVFYSFLARCVWLLGGRSEVLLRLPSILAGTLTIPIFWYFIRRRSTGFVAAISAIVLALHPMHVVLSRSARGYSLLALGAVLSTVFFSELLRRSNSFYFLAYVITASLMVWSHLYGVVVVFCQVFCLLFLCWRKELSTSIFQQTWLSFGLAGLATIFLYAPVFPLLLLELGREKKGLVDSSFPQRVMQQFLWTPSLVLALIVSALFCLGFFSLWRKHNNPLFLFYTLAPTVMAWLIRARAVGFARFALFALPWFLWLSILGLEVILTFAVQKHRELLMLFLLLPMLLWWGAGALDSLDSSGFRQSVTAVPNDSQICALGGDAYLFEYYAAGRLIIPKNEREFRQLRKGKKILYCVFHDVRWASSFHRQLFDEYGKDKKARRFGDVVLFDIDN